MAITETPNAMSSRIRVSGIVLALVGLAHFVIPDRLVPMMAPTFPRNTRTHILVNGGVETALGVGLAVKRTRVAAAVGALAYVAYIATTAARNR